MHVEKIGLVFTGEGRVLSFIRPTRIKSPHNPNFLKRQTATILVKSVILFIREDLTAIINYNGTLHRLHAELPDNVDV